MEHLFYAEFDDAERAQAVAAELERLRCKVVVHRDAINGEELPLKESGSRAGAAVASVLGGALGAVVGGVVVGPAGAGLGAVAGALGGGIMGSVAGAGAGDPRLEALEPDLATGHVLLAVEASGWTGEETAEALVERNGGRVTHRTV
jgi:uncharacterized membrane protein